MGAITNQQALAIMRGNRMFITTTGPSLPSSTKWSGVTYKDLLNPAGINLTNSGAGSPVYPYVPGSADPPSQVFTIIKNSSTIVDGTTSVTKIIYQSGGNINSTATLQAFEADYHKTGAHLQKKLK